MAQPLRVVIVVAVAVGYLAGSKTPAAAQDDHLKCYKVRDPLAKTRYTADLAGLVAEPGCLVKVPAKLACVPATKTNVAPAPPGGGPSGTPNAFLCYAVKCPKSAFPQLPVQDQFGSRTLTPRKASLLCAPATAMTTTTTTTTTVSCPTTTFLPACSGTTTCSGFCPGLQNCTGTGACGCVGPPVPCGSVASAFLCQFGECPQGSQCKVATVDGCPSGCSCQ